MDFKFTYWYNNILLSGTHRHTHPPLSLLLTNSINTYTFIWKRQHQYQPLEAKERQEKELHGLRNTWSPLRTEMHISVDVPIVTCCGQALHLQILSPSIYYSSIKNIQSSSTISNQVPRILEIYSISNRNVCWPEVLMFLIEKSPFLMFLSY